MKELIEDYERRLEALKQLRNETPKGYLDSHKRLDTKIGCYNCFINDLKRAMDIEEEILGGVKLPRPRKIITPLNLNIGIKLKKLIRSQIVKVLKEGEYEEVESLDELNKLYALKVREELAEIQGADHKDIMEFVDLIDVAYSFARINGFGKQDIEFGSLDKMRKKGGFNKLALNNLNPSNPSNKIYFE